ncbi:pentatricopeptide repeat-containing protein At2g29760, chloroplastic-like [Phalaenopsis equestris]|uniref:pentatricopeptide repeat-containing protein At2g29760, chloroplastic-like n=1 Tax=Phalaenopsis equestris TaxID=78828 RepID=UPI0009E2CD7C|nr:pentatricopeptide repeat-containing protein At2g29760, chloroplastic-like [Phalaenopsis equestris]
MAAALCPPSSALTVDSPVSLQSHIFFPLLRLCGTPTELKQIHAFTIKTGIFHTLPVASRISALCCNPEMGSLDYARSVFDQIPEPNSFAWNSLIKRLVDDNHSHSALLLFKKMLTASSTHPDNFNLPCVIKACGKLGAFSEGKQAHSLALKTGLGGDSFVQSSLVSFYSKCDNLELAKKVFDRVCFKDLVTWNSLIDGYVRSDKIELARMMFDEMPERDSFSWALMINGYSKCGEIDTARELFDQMPEKNVVAWNAMIHGYMKKGDIESARELFDLMPQRTLVSWNSMISGFEKLGAFKEALEVYKGLFREGVAPNIVTLVSALSAVSGLAMLERGREIHVYINEHKFSLEGVLGISLIEMYSKCGEIESSFSIFRGIRRKKLGHWTAMIMGFGIHGMANRAIKLFMEMQEKGVRPHALAFVGLLNGCSHAGMVDEGRHFFGLISSEYGIEPTVEHYGCIVDLLCRTGNLHEAKDFIYQMPLRPNTIIWMSLLSGCRKHRNVEIGELAAKTVIELDPKAAGAYVLLSNIYASARLWDRVSNLRELMRTSSVRKESGCSFVEHDGSIHEFVVGDKSHPQRDEIYAKLNEMRERLTFAGYIPDNSQVLLYLEEKEKAAELAYHSERLAIAFCLINSRFTAPIRIVKNLQVCNDCHNATKLLSSIYNCEIIVRDNSRFHHFRNGSCSCMDYW